MLNDVEALIARVALGASIAAHGAQKEWGTFDGPGPAGAAGFMESLGFVPGTRYAAAAARTEVLAGALIALGLGGPAGPAALISTMVVAQTSVHAKNGFFAQKGGIELGVIYSAAALALVAGGFGRLSLDELLHWRKLSSPALKALIVTAGVAAALVILAQRVRPETIVRAGVPPSDVVPPGENPLLAASDERPVQAGLLAIADDVPRA